MIENRSVTAIILVAGNSTRFGKNRNKNFEIVNGKPILTYSLQKFDNNHYIDDMIVAIKENEREMVNQIIQKAEIHKPIQLVIGGNSRQESVYHCLNQTNSDIVIIHDGARPVIKDQYIHECIESMKECKGSSIGVKTKDTIKITTDDNFVIHTTLRKNTWIVQTPQCFDRVTLLKAHNQFKQDDTITDDCMLLEKNNNQVKMIEGAYSNIKVTTYEDINFVSEFLK